MSRFPLGMLKFQDALMQGQVFYFETKEKGLCALKFERNRYKLYANAEEKSFSSHEHINDAIIKVLSLLGTFV